MKKKYKYDGKTIFPHKLQDKDGNIFIKVDDGIYENAYVPQYRTKRGDITLILDVEKYDILESDEV